MISPNHESATLTSLLVGKWFKSYFSVARSNSRPFSFLFISQHSKMLWPAGLSKMCAKGVQLTIPWFRPLLIVPPRPTGASANSFNLFSQSTDSSDRFNQVVGFCRFVNDEAHRFLPNILSENLSDRFVHIQIWTIVGECHAEYLPTRQQAR